MRLLYCTIIFLLTACAGVQMLSQQEIYTEEFLKKIDSIQLVYRDGDKSSAISKLEQLQDETLNSDERAKKYNLLGVIYFSLLDYYKAIENFSLSKGFVVNDLELKAQVGLNLASSYYKTDELQLSESTLKDIDLERLVDTEQDKYFKLKLSLAANKSDSFSIVESLIFLGRGAQTLNEVENYQYRDLLLDNLKNLSDSEKGDLLDRYKEKSSVVVIYLTKREVSRLYFSGNKDDALSLLNWLGRNYSDNDIVTNYIDDFNNKVKTFSKIQMNSIGLLAPLTGKKNRFGKKVLLGVSTALEQSSNKKLNLFVRDNKSSKTLSVKHVEELILKEHVSVIIGGVFPHLAKSEYLTARKYGVLFISLSPVFLPRTEKNHLLIELPGSVESQVETISSERFKGFFGEKIGFLYPDSESGKAYLDEVWNKAINKEIEIKQVNNFKKGVKEYLAPVKKLLSLSYPREREEERKLWKEIYSINKRQVRIVNYLKPSVNFDWVFVPSYPYEAVQIIPTFQYYDAYNIKFVGGPSWYSKMLMKQKNSKARMYFVGDDPADFDQRFSSYFKEKHKRGPNFLETLSFESLVLVDKLIATSEFDERDDFESSILQKNTLSGITSSWRLKDSVWIKNMDVLKISRKGISKLFEEGSTI